MQAFMDTVEPTLVDTFILTRALRGPVQTAELGRMLRSIDVDWDEDLVRGRLEYLERTRHLQRDGMSYVLTEDGREDGERLLRLWGRILDEAGVRPTAPPDARLITESEVRSGPGLRPEGATSRDRAGEHGKDRDFDRRRP